MKNAKVLALLVIAITWGHDPGAVSKVNSSVGPTTHSSTYTLFCGLWRRDGGFDSTIRMKSSLLVGPLQVTPVLYMADGTEYRLPSTKIPTGGVDTVDVNVALSKAPASIASHISDFGSAALRYTYPSTGHLIGSMQVLDTARSLIFIYPFIEPGAMMDTGKPSSHQTIEGL